MSRPIRPASTALLLRRWACAWLALLMLAQMVASTWTGLHGTWHRHRPAVQTTAAPSTPLVRWRHGGAAAVVDADAHARLHQRGEAHDHAATDGSVMPLALDVASDAVAQLAAALAPGVEVAWRLRSLARHVHASSTAWVATSRSIAPPLKPPRG